MGPRRGASASNDASYGSARSTPTSNRNSRRSGGVPRLKSGCYTCRIRRKKCDESRGADGNGPCVSCSRLRLQCLGYGERRPTWLRDPATLEQTKQRIKSFLSQLGFSRSHRGDGSPTSDDEQDILYLDPAKINQHSSISPAPTAFSSSSLEDQNHQQHETSSVRGQHTPSYVPDYTNGMRGGSSDDTLSPASALTYPSSSCSFGGPVMSAPSLSGGYQPYGVDPFRTTPSTHPALTSSFGDLYTYDAAPVFNDPTLSLDPSHCITNHDLQPSAQSPDYYMSLQYPLPDMPMFFRDAWSQGLLKHYLHNVVQREYLLADPGVRNLIWASLNQSDTARNGACLLARLHYQSLDGSQQPRAQLLATLEREAKGMLTVYGCHDEGDTFAALQIVSCFLFLGGRGKWMTYLDFAITWVERVFQTSPYDWQETLRCQSEWSRFLIKTTMWFDVLGSVTRRQAPKLLTLYRNLYHGASLDDGESPASLIPVMGCENAIVLALAETSWLASWKANLTKEGRLSTPELVKMGKRIEEEYLKPTQAPPMTSFKGHEDPAVLCRRLTSAVFRASARVYLHSVISGDNPGCPEIMEAVKDTVDALRRVPENDAIAERAVVRMVVFSICIAGCLTNQTSHRTFLLHRLASQQVEAVGNCSEVRKVMEKVWELRQAGTSASWLDVIEQASPDGYLLLV